MALDKVVEGISESARKDANQLIASADKEKSSILQLADQNIANKRKEQEKQLEESVRRLRQQEVSSAELEAKRIVLNAKKEVLDRTFHEALAELSRLSDADKTRLYDKILSKGTKVIPQPKIHCPKGDARFIAPGMGAVQEMDMEPGLILESKDGMILLDYRFKTILDGVWEKELKNVSNMLFG
jgi:V/A-type H+-transporting ATPase subunit E